MTSQHKSLLAELEALMTGVWLTDMANFSAFFAANLPQINWIGFYLSDDKMLRLGPFVGQPACVEIGFTKGVCGAAYSQSQPLLVKDVHEFPGHIACDPKSRSEMVLPLTIRDKLVGVLDIDSPIEDRFQSEDLQLMQAALRIFVSAVEAHSPQPSFEIFKI